MKPLKLFILLFLTVSRISISQDKLYFNQDVYDPGVAEIVSSSIVETDDHVSQIFRINVPTLDKYYISAWLVGSFCNMDNMMEYEFSVNGNSSHVIKINKTGPQAVSILDQAFDLNAGTNSVTVKTKKPFSPNVEFIKVSLDKENCQISDANYVNYINKISKLELPENYASLRIAAEKAEDEGQVLKSYQLSNPQGNYDHEMDVDFGYTYSTYIGLDQGETYIIESKNTNCDPVLHVFYKDHPDWFTRSDDNSGQGYNAKLTFTAPYDGNYRILVRKNSASTDGTCHLYLTGMLNGYYVNELTVGMYVAVSGTEIECPETVSQWMSWFTADLTGDSHLLLLNKSSPERIIAENDDWTRTSDFDWGNTSRIWGNFQTVISSVVVVSGSSYSTTGNCDLYMNCKNSNIADKLISGTDDPLFPNLKAIDAIQSAPATFDYNCIAWSGGITSEKVDPTLYSSDYCNLVYTGLPAPNDSICEEFSSFDNYYTSERYVGATVYIISDSTESIVDLWYNPNNNFNEKITHASVRKPGNNHPHGYDWESKPGSYQRSFHPRHSLENNVVFGYGFVGTYYVPDLSNKKSLMMLDESIARGLSIIENVVLNPKELGVINQILNNNSSIQFDILKEKYELWKETWNKPEIAVHSRLSRYASSQEYYNFLNQCEIVGKDSWLFLFKKFYEGDTYTVVPIEELVIKKNMGILDAIKEENNLKKYNESGARIVRTFSTNTMKFIKKFLENEFNTTSFSEDFHYSNENIFSVFPNPTTDYCQISFEINEFAEVSAYLIDLKGNVVSEFFSRKEHTRGKYNYPQYLPNLPEGPYLVKLKVNNTDNVKLLIIK